jgi:hypothetical protein
MFDLEAILETGARIMARMTDEAWDAVAELAPGWAVVGSRWRWRDTSTLICVTALSACYQPSGDEPLELEQELPVMVDKTGGRVRARLRARDPRDVVGARLRVVLVVPVARPEGTEEVAFRPIEVPFDMGGVAEVDMPVRHLDWPAALPVGNRAWPAALLRMSVILPE